MLTGPILIAGAGALGSVIGGMLRAAGHHVTLLGRAAHLAAIAERSLIIDGVFGRREAAGFDLCSNIKHLRGRKFALIVVAVKSYDTAEIAPHLNDLIAADGIVLSAQNGLGNLEVLAQHTGAQGLLAARVIFGAELSGPAIARVTVNAEPVTIGPAPDLSGAAMADLAARASILAPAFSSAGIPTRSVADIRPHLWTKLFYNAALNPLGALLKVHYGKLGEDPDLRAIMDAIVHEAFAVARLMDIQLPYDNAADYLSVFYNRLLPATFNHRPSMLADLEMRGRTEIDAINGKVVELAQRLGLNAEINRTITGLIRASQRMRRAAAKERI